MHVVQGPHSYVMHRTRRAHFWNSKTLVFLLLWKVNPLVSTASLSLQGTEAPAYLSPSTLAVTTLLTKQPPSCSPAPHQVSLNSSKWHLFLWLASRKRRLPVLKLHTLVTPSRSSFASADSSNFWFPDLTLVTNPPSHVRGFCGSSWMDRERVQCPALHRLQWVQRDINSPPGSHALGQGASQCTSHAVSRHLSLPIQSQGVRTTSVHLTNCLTPYLSLCSYMW